ncbi:hypothetical protein PVAND_001194 [Polypedilum vanderplanki]|uniref:PBZ-type domain-containing protein n=1 Tax=Polypedilum vanderplanki TaxID=319348 RepID=A0A9J6BNG7_POLVA|nr:hypothetical protein PVAND_001194 [Polypedilum vanderplanki]
MVVVSLVSKNNEVIVLSNTETTQIGRGFFQCNDKRVSKNHGELTVEDKTIKLKSCSVNPIFYKINGKDGPVEILRKDSVVALGNRDMFSLLPNEFEFTIKIEDNENTSAFRVRPINEINDNLEAGEMAVSLSQIMGENNVADSNTSNVPDDNNQAVTSTTTSNVSSSARKRSLDVSQEESNDIKKIKPSSSNADTSQPSSQSEQASSNVEVKSEPVVVKAESTTTADNNASTSCQSNQNPAQQNLRPSCEFGIRCYRLTDDHRRAYAHPMDADYRRPHFPPSEVGAPRCPYWDACYRRNPEHFRTMEHPPADQYSTQRPPHMQNIYHPANNYNNGDGFDYDDFSDEEEDFDGDDSDVDQDYELDGDDDDGSHSNYEDDENNLEE